MILKIRKIKRDIFQNRIFYMMLIPGTVLTFIFSYLPMYGVVLAFKDYSIRSGILGSPWCGLENFYTLFDIPQFKVAFKNTIVINLLKLVFAFPIPIVLAVMINSIRSPYIKRPVQTILYLPHFVSWVIVAGILFSLLDEDGVVYRVLEIFGVKKFDILADGGGFLTILVLSDIWKEAGWGAIIYLAALTSISGEYYEAAKVDGASDFRMFVSITLPLLMPTISVMLILRVGGLVSGGFDQIYNLYNEQVYDVADVLDTFSYRFGIGEGYFEMGTAVGLIANVINIFLLIIANRLIKIMGGEPLY